jgi:uncharacterized damage-inducible protein DinB
MLALLRDLVQHKIHANTALLRAVQEHETAARDDELRKLLHHILLPNRYWFSLILGRPIDLEQESKVPETLATLAQEFSETHAEEMQWISNASEEDMVRVVESAHFPGSRFTVAQVLMQVAMHSHGHRAQAATMLRALGGAPPSMDFILWVKGRPSTH